MNNDKEYSEFRQTKIFSICDQIEAIIKSVQFFNRNLNLDNVSLKQKLIQTFANFLQYTESLKFVISSNKHYANLPQIMRLCFALNKILIHLQLSKNFPLENRIETS